ncbi:MAG: hypothetical protein QM654_06970 [Dysgonamonadaceae bacterium]
MNEISFTTEQKLMHSFIIKSAKASDDNISLFYGRMGASIIFYKYSRRKNNQAYARYADSLIDKIGANIHNHMPLSLDLGIFGIGWGLEYLIQNRFIDGIGAEVCEEINQKIMQLDPRRITDLSLETGLLGLIHYLLIHIRGCKKQNISVVFDSSFLSEINERVLKLYVNNGKNNLIVDIYNTFISTNILDYIPSISFFSNVGNIIKKDNSIGLSQNQIINKLIKQDKI